MKTKVDIHSWNRKEQFYFFKDYDIPFFNITAKLKCTNVVNYAKENNLSLFLCYMYASLRGVNEVNEFRYRIINKDIYDFKMIQAGTTVLKEDRSFAFAYFDYIEEFKEYYEKAKVKVEEAKMMEKLESSEENLGVIHYSTLPWINFEGIMHPRRFGVHDSIPKITFGKIHKAGDAFFIPCNVEANHALMDGLHVSMYFERMEEIISTMFK